MRIVNSLFLIVIMLSSVVVGPLSYSDNIAVVFAQTPDEISDISNYVIYGLEKVEIDKDVTIQSGNIGLHDDSKKKGELKIKKDIEFVDSESSVVANKIKIEKDAVIQNVFYNELDNKGEILGTENTPLELPVVNNLPEFPIFNAGKEKIDVKKDSTFILLPGDYGKIKVKKNAVLIFEGGIYNIESIKAGKNSQILFNSASEVRVEKDVKLDKMVTLGPHPDSDIEASDIIFFVGDDKKSKIEFGKSSVVHGIFFSPDGEIKMKKETHATGSFIANKIKIEKKVNLTLNSSNDIPIGDLVDEYLELIEKLDNIGSTLDQTVITQELIDELQNDLERISQIVIELQMRGYDGLATQIRQDTQMVGIVTFFDENTLEVLFEKQIPDHTLGIFAQIGLINEFANDDVPLTFEEQSILLQEGFELVNIITNLESDEIASFFVLASISAFHPSTGNTLTNVSLFLGQTVKASATLIREGLKACLKNEFCQEFVREVGVAAGADGGKIIQKIIDERWVSVLISGFVFNDLNNDTNPDGNERMPNEIFEIIYAHTARDISASPIILSDPDDGSFVFNEDFIYAPFRDITVNPSISENQIAEAWVQSTPEFRFTIPQNIPLTESILIDDVEIGMVKLATLNVLVNVNGGPLNESNFDILVEDDLSNVITKQAIPQEFVEFRILEGEFNVDITSQSGYFADFSTLGCNGIISIEFPPQDDCIIDMNFGMSPPPPTPGIFFEDDYSSNDGWTQVLSCLGCRSTDNPDLSRRGEITVDDPSFPGIVKFNKVQGGFGVIAHQAFKQLPSALPADNWTAETDYIFTESFQALSYPLAFTVTSEHPELQHISERLAITHGVGINQIHINTIHGSTDDIPLAPNTQYYLSLERSPTELVLSAFSDPERTIHVPGSPVSINILATDYTDLNYIQHAHTFSGGTGRGLTGEVDNTKIIGIMTTPPPPPPPPSNIFFEDDYSSDSGWTQSGFAIIVDDPSFPGVVRFNEAGGGGIDHRVFKQLPSALPADNWTAETDYRIIFSPGVNHYPFAFTTTSEHIELQQSSERLTITHGTASDQIHLTTVGGDSANIPLSKHIQYHLSLERSPTELVLSVFFDPAKTLEVPGSPVSINILATDYADLNFIQHSASHFSGGARQLTAEVDNTQIFD